MLAIVDYGVGNLANVQRALVRAGGRDVVITDDRAILLASRLIVLPGVGHFGHCARELTRRGLDAAVRDARAKSIPVLGLCVGMQLLFDGSDEDPGTRGLGLISGTVRRLRGAVRVPHTGWNEVRMSRSHPWLTAVPDGAHFYFVHSYAPEADAPSAVATTEHGAAFASIVGGEGLLGLQFHPEKSSLAGTRLLHSVVSAVA